MLSSFELNFDLTEEVNANNYLASPLTQGTVLKVYIPTLMANIPFGNKPQVSNLSTDGATVFKNANKKPAVSGRVLKELNYLEAKYNTETTSTDVNSVTTEITKYMKAHISPLVHNIKAQQYSYTIPEKSRLRVQFLNGKITKLSYYITNESNAKKTLSGK